MDADLPPADSSPTHRRRPRYSGKNPRKFHEKYKELRAEHYPETVEKVLASGKTPAGTHRPILLPEILELLAPQPGDFAVDCTLGYGGHAEAILRRVAGSGGHLLALDADPIEGPRTAARLSAAGFGPDVFSWERRNFAGLAALLAARRPQGADVILADLGVSSMQLDVPERGFSVKNDGPLDMRMNPQRGSPASEWLAKTRPETLAHLLEENADEPRADRVGGSVGWPRISDDQHAGGGGDGSGPTLGPGRHRAARFPSDSHRRERRVQRAGYLSADAAGLSRAGRPGGNPVVPFGRGPAGEAGVPRGAASGGLCRNRGGCDPARPAGTPGKHARRIGQTALGKTGLKKASHRHERRLGGFSGAELPATGGHVDAAPLADRAGETGVLQRCLETHRRQRSPWPRRRSRWWG